jgi:autotransporter family porin
MSRLRHSIRFVAASLAAAVLLVLVAAHAPATAAPAGTAMARTAAAARGPVVTFRLRGVDPAAVVGAVVTRGGRRRTLAVAKVRRAARRGVLRVRAPRRRGKAKLLLRLDRKAPRTRITSRRRVRSKRGARRVRITFRADERRTRFSCRLNGKRWRRCASPVVYREQPRRAQRVEVRGRDSAGNVGAPATVTWTAPPVSQRQPEQTTQPAAPAPRTPAAGTPALQPPGTAPLSDAEAASRVVRSVFEPRPENGSANRRVPTAQELAQYRAARTYELCDERLDLKVTGNFTGTTDEILQWGAWKWGLDLDLLRAVAVVETTWQQSLVGDAGESFGLTQVKRTVHEGTFPLSRDSTAFAVDYYGAFLRHYYNGCASWLNDEERGGQYAAGDIWGSLGSWFAGRWLTAPANDYIGKVKRELDQRRWERGAF